MKLLNLEISSLAILQIGIGAFFIFVYSLLISFREPIAHQASDSQMILLTALLVQHVKGKTLDEITQADEKTRQDQGYNLRWFAHLFQEFQEKGQLPGIRTYEESTASILLQHAGFVFAAPIVAIGGLANDLYERRDYRAYRIVHTEVRKNYVAKEFLMLVGCLAYIGLAWVVRSSSIPGRLPISYVVLALTLPGLVATIIDFLLIVWSQSSWKGYWQDQLFRLMASAAKDNNHDLFNRCVILRREISSEPNIPIPGDLAAYAVLFSFIQAGLVWVSRNTAWL